MKSAAYVLALAIALGAGLTLSGSFTTPAMAGNYTNSGYAGYDWSDTYPPWAAEAFQPTN